MFNDILVVCVGNICRSPVLERLLQRGLPQARVQSAGLAAVVGSDIDPAMQSLLRANGVADDGHVARDLALHMLQESDLVIAMERGHQASICKRLPAARGKVMLASHWLDGADVSDPYRKSAEVFERCYHQLDDCASSWLQRLA